MVQNSEWKHFKAIQEIQIFRATINSRNHAWTEEETSQGDFKGNKLIFSRCYQEIQKRKSWQKTKQEIKSFSEMIPFIQETGNRIETETLNRFE